MWSSRLIGTVTTVFAAATLTAASAGAADFDWKKHEGETITFLANNNPWATAVLKHKDEFEKLTGITLRVDTYQEQQMRQRLLTVMNAQSDEVDIFMTLPSREGAQFAAAGWYKDLTDFTKDAVAEDYDFAGISPALVKAALYDGKLTGVPLNIEGPLVYYRTDIFEKCDLSAPTKLSEIKTLAEKIKACDSAIAPFASRGLKPAVPYTFSVFLHNMGGSYMKDGKSNLCSAEGKAALEYYSTLLKDYGPPGVVNYSFYQLSSLYREGRSAISFQSSNELRSVMEGGARLNDTAIIPLPPGEGGFHPTVIGWALAISSFSANYEAAWYFVQWATSPEMQKNLALEGIAAPRSSVAKAPEFEAWLKEKPVRQQWQAALDRLAEDGTSEVGYPIVQNPESREFIGRAVNDILLGSKSVDVACADADKSLNELIARQ